MREIKILGLTLENFKCHRHLELNFDGRNAAVFGDNATGKTSIYDALTWLLFGKDSLGNGEKNMEIKPLDSTGEVRDHAAITEVSALLQVDGQPLSLRRTYREVWSAKRGSGTLSYDGNTSEYFWDGVPLKCGDYTERVNALLPEERFRMLTDLYYFSAKLPWQERRAVLFEIAGVPEDTHILAAEPRFAPLLEAMGKLPLAEYKQKLLAEKKKFIGVKNDVPARLSECEKTVADISGLDFAAAKAEAARLQAAVEAVSGKLLALEHTPAAEQKRMELTQAELALSTLENENIAYRLTQEARLPELHSLELGMTALQSRISRQEQEIQREKACLAKTEKDIQQTRQQWNSINAAAASVPGTCPACGQPLPPEQVQKARDAAEAQKQQRLDRLVETANAYKEDRQQAEERLAALEQEAVQLGQALQERQKQLQAAQEEKGAVADLPDYGARKQACMDTLQGLTEELAHMTRDSSKEKARLRQELEDCKTRLMDQNAVITKETLLEYSRNRIQSLREEARQTAALLEAVEQQLMYIEEYTRYKTRFVEESVNRHFRLARFRLFRQQANGGLEERCDVVCDGVPYGSINNGMKINLGIDIINTLSTVYGVRVPLFVDNAESVTHLEACGSQVIRLLVSEEDKELKIKYEPEN